MQIMQMFNQFISMSGYNENNAEAQASQIIRQANLNQTQLNKVQNGANMIYGIAQRFGLIK